MKKYITTFRHSHIYETKTLASAGSRMFDPWPSNNALWKNINKYGGRIGKKVCCDLLFLVSILSLKTVLFQQLFKNTYLCFLTARLIMKTQLKEIYKNNTSLIFKSNFSMNCSISELICHKVLIFFLKFMFSKEYYFDFLMSLKHSEKFLLLLPPGLNCSIYKLFSPKCKISEPRT